MTHMTVWVNITFLNKILDKQLNIMNNFIMDHKLFILS